MIRGRRPAYQPRKIKVRWGVYTLGTVQAEPTEGRSLRRSWQDEPYPPIFQQHCVPQWGRGGGPSTNRTVNTRGHKMDGLNINLWSALCHTRKNTQTLGRSWVSWYQRPVLCGRLVEEGRVIRLMLFMKHIRLNANEHYSLGAGFYNFFHLFLGETRRAIPRDDFVSGERYLWCLVVACFVALCSRAWTSLQRLSALQRGRFAAFPERLRRLCKPTSCG